MAKPFRPKRNTTQKNDEFTGKPYEITLDCERQELRIHDGVNAGGFPTARAADLKSAVRLSHTQYKKGDIVACPDRNDVVLECLQAGQTANRYVSFKNIIGGAGVTDGSVVWQLKIPYVKAINGVEVDRYGNIDVDGLGGGGGVQTINGQSPDESGNIDPSQVGCLPLSGGTMTGAISGSGGLIRGSTDTSDIWISGGTNSSANPYIQLNGGSRSSNSGVIEVVSRNANTTTSLKITPDGNCTWGGKNIVRSVNGTSADASGNVEVDAMPELLALPYTDKAEIKDGETYEYEMKDDGFVTLYCKAGTGRRFYSGGGGDGADYWEEYRDEGNTTLQGTVNGLSMYPSKNQKGSQGYTEQFFLKKCRKISVYCKRSYKYNVIPHSFSIKVLPHA